MSHDETLAQRVWSLLQASGLPGIETRTMFGGVGYLVNGNMACGVHRDFLVVRVGPEAHTAALARPHARPFDITGRAMRGWVMVEPAGCAEPSALQAWMDAGLVYTLSLPPKGLPPAAR